MWHIAEYVRHTMMRLNYRFHERTLEAIGVFVIEFPFSFSRSNLELGVEQITCSKP